jgi:hypothetical protein
MAGLRTKKGRLTGRRKAKPRASTAKRPPKKRGVSGKRTAAGKPGKGITAKGRPPAAITRSRATRAARIGRVIHAPAGADLVVEAIVDDNHRVPYAVGFDGIPIIHEVVSASATVRLTPGLHALTWRFVHDFESGWSHELTGTVSAQTPVLLDKKSAANGDPSNSNGGVDYQVP